jgi:hypothetical protein
VEVAKQLGLSELQRNRFHILACTAKTPPGQPPDPRLREGLSWLVSAVDSVYTQLDSRVQQEAEAVRQEELRKKKEREERARLQREERLRQQQQREAEEAAAAAAGAQGTTPAAHLGPGTAAAHDQGQANGRSSIQIEATSQHNVLSALPGSIQSPKPAPDHLRVSIPPPGASATSLPLLHPVTASHGGGPSPDFSDLQAHRADQSSRSLAPRPQSGTQPAEHVVTILSESPGPRSGVQPSLLSEQPEAQIAAISIEPAVAGHGPRSSADGGASIAGKRSASIVRGSQNKIAPTVV